MFSAPKAKRQVHELKTPQERSDEETEAMPAKSVHRSGNQQATMVTLLNRTGRTLPGFFNSYEKQPLNLVCASQPYLVI